MENEMEPPVVVFSLIISFLAGIFSTSFSIAFGIMAVAAAVFVLGWITLLGFKYKKTLLSIVAVFFLAVFYFHAWGAVKNEFSKFPENGKEFTAVVINEPQQSSGQYSFSAKLQDPYHGTIKILTYQGESISYGDLLELNGEKAISKLPFEALYKAKENKILKNHQASVFRESLITFKNHIASFANEYFTAREASLLNGMIIGKQGDFDATLKKEMSLSGTTHLVALSGYNVGILVWCVFLILSSFLPRRAVAWCSLFIIALFVAMVGAEASVVRAAVMAFFMVVTQTFGRPNAIGNSILLSAFLMVLVNPQILVFDIGFQLSFLSLLGIAYLHDPLARLFHRSHEKEPDPMPPWKENFITTCAAQLGVLPILLIYFGQFSFFAIISNILILQLVPLTMFFGFCIALGGLMFKFLPILFVIPASVLLQFELGVIHFFSRVQLPLPAALFSGGMSVVIYYALLFIFVFHQKKKNSRLRPQIVQ